MQLKDLRKLYFLLIEFRDIFGTSDIEDDINCILTLVEDEIDLLS
jgi:hypothetical protein